MGEYDPSPKPGAQGGYLKNVFLLAINHPFHAVWTTGQSTAVSVMGNLLILNEEQEGSTASCDYCQLDMPVEEFSFITLMEMKYELGTKFHYLQISQCENNMKIWKCTEY